MKIKVGDLLSVVLLIMSWALENFSEKKLTKVKIDCGVPKALEVSTDFSINELCWKYTACKAGNSLKTGETKTQLDLNGNLTLSQGYQNFVIYGYKDENLIAEGSASSVLIAAESKRHGYYKSEETCNYSYFLFLKLQQNKKNIRVSQNCAFVTPQKINLIGR